MSEPIATNKKAYHNYFLTEKWECGIELKGAEVKSIRAGEVNFADSYVGVDEGEVWLHKLHIAPYAQASYLNTEPERSRKLLLHQKEIQRLYESITRKRLTCVPTKIYVNARGLVKVEIALAQGKKSYDKRADIKERESKRQIARATRRARP
ncbi:MAG: SsrA-binding protein SmpB [Candidatus Omnitrophica bacterium]|nr:SsrA-binding protein SmpB [Candidatus Omnitrophota bacterium]